MRGYHAFLWLVIFASIWGLMAGAVFSGGMKLLDPTLALFGLLGNVVLALTLFSLIRNRRQDGGGGND